MNSSYLITMPFDASGIFLVVIIIAVGVLSPMINQIFHNRKKKK